VELDGRPVFGDGKLQWLELIEQSGSIRNAAELLGMSYRGLWGRLKVMERRLGMKLLARQKGGSTGGGSTLTDGARSLIERYRQFRKGIDGYVDRRFEAVFDR